MANQSLIADARRVVFQGELGSYSHLAALEALPQCEPVPAASFEKAFAVLREGGAELSLIPIENSLHGRIADVHYLLPEAPFHIVGEYFQHVHHQLLGVPGATVEGLRTVESQEPALGQCRKIIQELGLRVQPWSDTAAAARHVAERNDPSLGAIASALAAEIHHLSILKRDVEDADHNVTRFLILSPIPELAKNTGAPMITSLIFRVRNVPAALHQALGGFAKQGVNLTKLESYQLEGSFSATQFYADIEGHPEEPNVHLAFDALRSCTTSVKILGVYPAASYRAVVRP